MPVRTPTQLAQHLGIHPNAVYRFIDGGELLAVVHPEALDLFGRSRLVVDPYRGPSAAQMLADLEACEPVLLADYMERPDVAGGFFKALAGALRRADPGNRSSLYAAFPVTLHKYLLAQRAWAERYEMERA